MGFLALLAVVALAVVPATATPGQWNPPKVLWKAHSQQWVAWVPNSTVVIDYSIKDGEFGHIAFKNAVTGDLLRGEIGEQLSVAPIEISVEQGAITNQVALVTKGTQQTQCTIYLVNPDASTTTLFSCTSYTYAWLGTNGVTAKFVAPSYLYFTSSDAVSAIFDITSGVVRTVSSCGDYQSMVWASSIPTTASGSGSGAGLTPAPPTTSSSASGSQPAAPLADGAPTYGAVRCSTNNFGGFIANDTMVNTEAWQYKQPGNQISLAAFASAVDGSAWFVSYDDGNFVKLDAQTGAVLRTKFVTDSTGGNVAVACGITAYNKDIVVVSLSTAQTGGGEQNANKWITAFNANTLDALWTIDIPSSMADGRACSWSQSNSISLSPVSLTDPTKDSYDPDLLIIRSANPNTDGSAAMFWGVNAAGPVADNKPTVAWKITNVKVSNYNGASTLSLPPGLFDRNVRLGVNFFNAVSDYDDNFCLYPSAFIELSTGVVRLFWNGCRYLQVSPSGKYIYNGQSTTINAMNYHTISGSLSDTLSIPTTVTPTFSHAKSASETLALTQSTTPTETDPVTKSESLPPTLTRPPTPTKERTSTDTIPATPTVPLPTPNPWGPNPTPQPPGDNGNGGNGAPDSPSSPAGPIIGVLAALGVASGFGCFVFMRCRRTGSCGGSGGSGGAGLPEAEQPFFGNEGPTQILLGDIELEDVPEKTVARQKPATTSSRKEKAPKMMDIPEVTKPAADTAASPTTTTAATAGAAPAPAGDTAPTAASPSTNTGGRVATPAVPAQEMQTRVATAADTEKSPAPPAATAATAPPTRTGGIDTRTL